MSTVNTNGHRVAATLSNACESCQGRPKVMNYPAQGANVYRDGRDPNHRATEAARLGVTATVRNGPKRFSRNRKHTTGSPFSQQCLVCKGEGVYEQFPRQSNPAWERELAEDAKVDAA
jgi:hypothetical protein